MEKTLTVIIPAYNESKRILHTLADIDEYISKKSAQSIFKVLTVNDGSTDNTKQVVSDWINKQCKNKNCFSVYSYAPNFGKGYSVKEGIVRADTELVMYTDADGASPAKEVEKLLFCINNGYDVACGSRILKGTETNVKMGFNRRLIGFLFHLILKSIGLADIKDTQCGFKMFKTKLAKQIAGKQKCINYSFDVEYLLIAKKLGGKVKEVAVNWYHVEGTKVNILKDSLKMLLEVLKIKFVYKYD